MTPCSTARDQNSDLQSAEQPSPLFTLPSSQTSPPSRMPSPQRGIVQSVRHLDGESKAEMVTGAARSRARGPGASSSNSQDEMPDMKVGAMVMDHIPGKGRAEKKPPSLLRLKCQSPCAVVGEVR